MKHLISSLACLGLLAPALAAASVGFVGVETGTAVENWSNTSVLKTHALNGDNRYGGAGYYQILPAAVDADFGESWSVPLDDPNDLGINLPEEPLEGIFKTLHSKPDFLASAPSGGGGSCFIFNTNPVFSNSTGTGSLRQGSLAVSITDFEVPGPGGSSASKAKAFSFTLSQAAGFRLGVAVGTLGVSGGEAFAPDNVSVFNVSTGEVFSSALIRDGIADLALFDITGNAGDEFVVNLWQTNAAIGLDGPIAFALVTFDQLPAPPPPPAPTLNYALNAGNIILSWDPESTGWILESSTDLGSSDLWDPVPGVVGNSVTLSTSGVPKNFFRLRKDP